MKDDSGSDAPRLILFGGQYRWHDQQESDDSRITDSPDIQADANTAQISRQQAGPHAGPRHAGPGHAASGLQTQSLAPYSHFSEFLVESAHIGLEVAEPNIERKYSQSFRSLEFLRHGLPLICNDYLPIASLIEKYNAGWLVSGPQELPGLLRKIMSQPDEWKKRSENALRSSEPGYNRKTPVGLAGDASQSTSITKANRTPCTNGSWQTSLVRPPEEAGLPAQTGGLEQDFSDQ
jgi:hypothetical protein